MCRFELNTGASETKYPVEFTRHWVDKVWQTAENIFPYCEYITLHVSTISWTVTCHCICSNIIVFVTNERGGCRFEYPSGVRRGSAASLLLGLRVRIPPDTWMFVWCVLYNKDKRGNQGHTRRRSTDKIQRTKKNPAEVMDVCFWVL